jgi:TonB-dependent receptor
LGFYGLKKQILRKMKNFVTFLTFFGCFSVLGQNGFLRGNLIGGDDGQPVLGATVTVEEIPGKGTTSDIDGNYSLSLPAGTYTIKISFISYQIQLISDVVIKAGEVTLLDATLKTSSETLQVVNVVHTTVKNTEATVLLERKNATNVTDGISAQAFRKVGDSDLSGAMKRVTGVTVTGGKYVYVRGLGDRYTLTTLNGMILPGIDPDVNAIQIDIFPTAALENVGVSKTFSPELYGDFAGGLVNIVTKKFPEKKTTQISLGGTFTPGMHLNPDFLTYEGGKMDRLGYDDGTRKLPFNPYMKLPDEVLVDPVLEDVTRSFNPTLGVKYKSALPNGSFSFYHGNQKNREDGSTLGYSAVFNYSTENVFYKGFQSNDYLKDTDFSRNEMLRTTERIGDVGKQNVMWTGLLSASYKKSTNSYSVSLLNTQTGESTASKRYNSDFNQNQSVLAEEVLTYTSRTLSSLMINGSHKIKNTEVTWANATSYSRVYDPDFRETRVSITGGDTTLSTGNGSGIDRFWRNLKEYNETFKGDVKFPIGKNTTIRTGVTGLLKMRDFEVFSYKHRRTNLSNVTTDPNWYLQEDNIWSADEANSNFRNGTYTIGNYQPANNFEARQMVFSSYVMAEQQVVKKLKIIYGVRAEKNDMFYTGQNNIGTVIYQNEKTLSALNILPAFNSVFALNDKTNIRLGATRTVARPSFKEKSIAQIYDPITKRTFIGNIDLQQTMVNNFDFRYEVFMKPKEIFSVSAFYKQFDGHIEMVSFAVAPNNLTPRNSGQSYLIGTEFELRKSLGDTESETFMSRFFVTTNISLVKSAVDLKSVYVDNSGQTEYDLRKANLRTDEVQAETRKMAGQSPYSINVSLAYELPDDRTGITLAYNVQGEQLSVIGSGRVADVYTVPFNSLNFNGYRSFGKDNKSKITLGVTNLLNDDVTLVYKSFNAENKVYTSYKPGVGLNFKYSYSF